MEAEKLRIRLVFGNGVLTKTQKNDGLKRSWLLLKPNFLTISDVVSYILHSFDLLHSCPHGIILSMDGYVLPGFESTSILKDKDLISVKRKATKLLDANKDTEEARIYIEDEEVEKQPLTSDVMLLANEMFDGETKAHQNESDEDKDESVEIRSPVPKVRKGDVGSKKRKASSKLEKTNKKRKLQAVVSTIKETPVNECDSEHMHITKPRKKRKGKNNGDQNDLTYPKPSVKNANDLEPKSNSESEPDENREDTIDASATPDKAKKVSRSTLRRKTRKKIKKMLRNKAKREEELRKCDGQQPVNSMPTTDTETKKDMAALATIVQQDGEDDSDEDGDLVPVVIRPGLIRFTPSDKVKEVQENLEANGSDVHSTQNGTWKENSARKDVSDVKHNHVAKEAYCWNGITNKRKGQKWGQEMQSTSTWKEPRNRTTHSSNTWDGENQSTSSWKDSGVVNGDGSARTHSASLHESADTNGQSEKTCADKENHINNKSVDFDKLIPLINLPKAGDVIAYRILELSSSWCPELSSFRVGKVSSIEPDSNRIILVPVPEYPLSLDRPDDDDDDDDDGDLPFQSSAYNEDGSLEIDFPSLSDVRLMKLDGITQTEGTKATNIAAANGNSSPSTCKTVDAAEGSKKAASDVGNQALHSASRANGKKDVWEEITEAVSEKKAQLMQKDNWNKKDTAAKRPWSFRSLRSSAIGPTMARLRAQNGS